MTNGDTTDDACWPLTADGVWLAVSGRRLDRRGPGLVLDRDGVIVEDIGYPSSR